MGGRQIRIPAGNVALEGDLHVPAHAIGVVAFAHGSGSSRHSSRNRLVAERLRAAGLGTLLFDLLTEAEEAIDSYTTELRFDIGLLAERLIHATNWLAQDDATATLPLGYFGASTGAAAALVAVARQPATVGAIVARGGRPDLAGAALASVQAPTLLIVGGDDVPVIAMNEDAHARLAAPVKHLVIVPGATHLFEEPGALEEVARLAADWFVRQLDVRARAQGV